MIFGRQSRRRGGVLMVNADDWGRDRETTNRTKDCLTRGTVNAVSAMVFMRDSERAADLALASSVDTGLHLNFTADFSLAGCPLQLREHHGRVARYLRSWPLARTVFHPGLRRAFDYVVSAQIDEFCRLYGDKPSRMDGHHHMHLCANVVFGNLLPKQTIVRRNFSFQAGEKNAINRYYRRGIDHLLGRHHIIGDFFFSLEPIDVHRRIPYILSLAKDWYVEIETHPVNPDEYKFLMSPATSELLKNIFSGDPDPELDLYQVRRCHPQC